MHITSRNQIFYFRLAIPKELRPTFGRREIKRSLHTSDHRAAKVTASILAHRLKETFRVVHSSTLAPAELQALVGKHVNETLLIMDEVTVTSSRTSLKQAQRGAEVREILQTAQPLNSLPIVHTQGDSDAQDQVPKPRVGVVQQPMAAPDTAPVVIQANPSVTLAELISRYNDEREDRWSVSTRNNYQGIAKVMRQLIGGDVPVNTIDRTVFRIYRGALRRLPKRFSNHPDFESMSSHRVLEMDKPDITIEPKVVNKYISYASSLFKWARVMGYMDENPAEGMRVMVEDKETAMFEDDDLARIFGGPDYAPENPSQFWVPLLGLYTGARLNEICQLYVKDIAKVEDGEGAFWWISINDEGDDKTVKTKNGRRIVPVHPVLVRLGFIEYVEALYPEDRVFPELSFSKHRKNYSGQISKSFNRLLAHLKVKPTQAQQAEGMPNKTFHTFRHTAITALLRANADGLMMAAVVGHDKKLGVTGNYFHGYEPRQLYNDVVTQLDYAVDVFGLLKGHEFAMPMP